MLASGLMIAQMVAAKALRDSVFLSSFPSSALPAMTIAAAVFAIAASMAGSRFLHAIPAPRLVPSAFLVSALLQLAERSLFLAVQQRIRSERAFFLRVVDVVKGQHIIDLRIRPAEGLRHDVIDLEGFTQPENHLGLLLD